MEDYAAFVDAAADALTQNPATAVANLGLAELLQEIGPEAELVGYAFLEAQGRTGASTHASSLVALSAPTPAALLGSHLTTPLTHPLPGQSCSIIFGPSVEQALVDVPNRGLLLVDVTAVTTTSLIADAHVHPVAFNASAGELLVPESAWAPHRADVLSRLRLGASVEILGTCETMMAEAITHVAARRQFGQAVGSFTSIRELLAYAATDRQQLHELLALCLSLFPLTSPDGELATMAKALAGTSGLRIARSTMQATGAIAFTAEHRHGSFFRRVLALDAVSGSSAEICRRLGAAARTTGHLGAEVDLQALAASIG